MLIREGLPHFQMLQFYERHVRIIKREDPDAESVSSVKGSNAEMA